MQSAEQQVLSSIDELLSSQENSLVIPYSALNAAVADIVSKNTKVISKLIDKIVRHADREQTVLGDALDAIQTTVLNGLDAYIYDQEYLLSQLAAKGGLTKAGDPLTQALLTETTQAGQLAYQGTLVLAVKEAIPFFTQLIEVLREIRDRMPELPLRTQGETPADAPAMTLPSADQFLAAMQSDTGAATVKGDWIGVGE